MTAHRAHGVALALALSVSAHATTAHASDADPWFGRDKGLHFGVSTALAIGGYAAASLAFDGRGERAIAGSAFSLTIGAGKELWDWTGRGDPSWRDFTWDVVGTLVGTTLALATDALVRGSGAPSVRATGQGLIVRF